MKNKKSEAIKMIDLPWMFFCTRYLHALHIKSDFGTHVSMLYNIFDTTRNVMGLNRNENHK